MNTENQINSNPATNTGETEVLDLTNRSMEKDTLVEALKEVEAQKIKTTSNTTTVQLPSNGLINPNITEVTLRRMTTKEVKTLHTSKDPNFLTVLILGCIVDPVNVTEKDIHPNDVIYLIFILRYISSPKNIEQKTVCNHCRKEFNSTVKVEELGVDYANIDVDLTVHLEEEDCDLDFRILSEGDIIASEKIADRQIKQNNIDDDKWYKLISKLGYMITAKDGKDFESFRAKVDFLESLSAYDFETFRKAYEDITSSFGLKRDFLQECPHCKRDVEVMAYFAPDFFRLV